MKNTIKILTLVMIVALAYSCKEERKPNYQYMPNMYESVGYETYGEYPVFENGQEAKLPVEGTVPRGWMPYDLEFSNQGYQIAKDSLKNPIAYTEENLGKGKALYDIYCAVCHGAKGDGQGILVKREKILGVPAYNDAGRAINEGSIYHVMYYGINSMGSYASQTSIEERWQIVAYVEKLKAELDGKEPRVDKLNESDEPSNMIPAVNAEEVSHNEEAH